MIFGLTVLGTEITLSMAGAIASAVGVSCIAVGKAIDEYCKSKEEND